MKDTNEMKGQLTRSLVNDLIKQYKIPVSNEEKISNKKKIVMRCEEDYFSFHKYKERKFFNTNFTNQDMKDVE